MTSSTNVSSGYGLFGQRPSWREDSRWVLLGCLFVYLVTLALRLSLSFKYNHPLLMVGDEHIMTTHDSYLWLARAKGVGSMDFSPLAQLAYVLHEYLGISLGAVGFWAPAVLAGMTSVVAFLWGWLLGGRTAGFAAGLIGAMNPGFFYRSRLGYYDTDLFTLSMPLLVGFLLAWLLKGVLREGWLPKCKPSAETTASLWLALAFGLIGKFAIWWHQDIANVAVIIFIGGVALVAVAGAPGRRVKGWLLLAVFGLGCFPGMAMGSYNLFPIKQVLALFMEQLSAFYAAVPASMALGVLLAVGIILAHGKGLLRKGDWWLPLVIILLLALAAGLLQGPWRVFTDKILEYLKPAADAVQGAVQDPGQAKVIYPSIVQSIIEAGNVDLAEIMRRMAFWPWLGWLSLAALAVVTAFRPSAVLLLPLAVLSLASVSLGVRFTMFGGTCLAVGLAVAADWAIAKAFAAFKGRDWAHLAVQLVLGLAILVPNYIDFRAIPPGPVITRTHAEALVALGKNVPKDSMVWTWWDWGYASQYYAGLDTVVDGGKHAGRDVYPVAKVMVTDSPQQAEQMIRFSAQFPAKILYALGYSPADQWDAMPADEVTKLIADMRAETVAPPPDRQQYLVVTWKNLTLASWISFFGDWDLKNGTGQKGASQYFPPGNIAFDINRGALRTRNGNILFVESIDELRSTGAVHRSFLLNSLQPGFLDKMPHMLLNDVSKQTVLYEDKLYDSLMCRMMLAKSDDPEISKYFTLVVDAMPFARIYRVK